MGLFTKPSILSKMNDIVCRPARFRVPPRPGGIAPFRDSLGRITSGEFGNSPAREQWRAGGRRARATCLLPSSGIRKLALQSIAGRWRGGQPHSEQSIMWVVIFVLSLLTERSFLLCPITPEQKQQRRRLSSS
jgi:hypothetical protein